MNGPEPTATPPSRRRKNLYFEMAKLLFVALVIVTLVRLFVAQPFVVSGASMQPSFHSGDYLIVDKLGYDFRPPQIGDVIVFQYPLDPSLYLIKRIVALPGETVIEGTGEVVTGAAAVQNPDAPPYADATSSAVITLASDEYYVLGDNPSQSTDSRQWGPLQRKFIVGRVIARVWPISL